MSKKIKVPKSNSGYAYSGVWRDGRIGWFGVPHLSGGPYSKKHPNTHDLIRIPELKGERVFLCKVTITPVRDKKGRPITKIYPK